MVLEEAEEAVGESEGGSMLKKMSPHFSPQ